ncbi:helix-turn-helix transcriptional regulator [Herbiconiux ginsengi]|uniref:Helix-turn-helix domain-containing protein n=1 Tax=Herbiconiux ginsengi TaxID=381665 RepID=A0A1H3LEE8_9MICO|nr:helix-turn-helix transcriptional regulator [Herbiconiux ginsengi]SDY62706.1 Helix-turn-helix domain-containing protein [Herbiconiux ginsengi]
MTNQQDVREFLGSRRARITPEQAGLPTFGGTRRVPGLRRTEVAMLAGVSPEYYTRLERGNLAGVSENVLEGVARALSLDEAERAHLFDLARAASAGPMRARRKPQPHVRPSIQRILDAITEAPAFIRNGRFDVLAENALGSALYAPLNESPERPVNHARYIFLDPNAPSFWGDWERVTRDTVAVLRAEAGRDPYDRGLTDLIGELSTRSELFRMLWAAHDVQFHRSGTKVFHHPVVGELELAYEGFDLTADPGLTLLTYSAEPGTPSADALNLLATWAATQRSERSSSSVSSSAGTDASTAAETQA